MELPDWYRVRVSALGIHLEVSPPNRPAWQADILWSDIVRVCLAAEDGLISDAWYFFTKHRPESYVVPVEADGGEVLLEELLKRKLFDAQLLIRAACATNQLFCWSPAEENRAKTRYGT